MLLYLVETEIDCLIYIFVYIKTCQSTGPGPIFIERKDVLPQDLVKPWINEIEC